MAMNEKRLSNLLGLCIVPAILESSGQISTAQIDQFYRSELYAMLSDPRTGLWHLSARTLASMYAQELTDGSVEVPEEQS